MDIPRAEGLSSAFDSPTFGENSDIHVDKPVGSMSISPCGRDVVLASRQGLHVLDLDSPYSQPRHLPHHTPWEVADVQWSPFAARDFWVVSTSNQKALVWNLEMKSSHASIEHVLHAHTRAITDINFSAHHPDILATCAVDSFVHCWDLRRPARPAMTFCDWFAGATQVKWNRQDSHIIASSHDKYLRIWDDRKGAYPLRSIEAHDTKIYGIDWNRTRSTGIVTCSLDKTIKFWDYANLEDQPERTIRTCFPVWRARHTPFGWGLLAMPQRGNNDLHLYDRRLGGGQERHVLLPQVRKFEGHRDQVKEFLWRSRGEILDGIDNREFQLVSWGTDRHLRLHSVDEKTLSKIGYVKGQEIRRKLNLTRKGAEYKTFRDEATEPQQGKNPNSVPMPLHRRETVIAETPNGASIAGMRKAPIPSARAWADGGFMSSRSRMHGKNSARKEINPIAWMRGVKIGKREPGQYSRHDSVSGTGLSTFSPDFRGFETSDSPEKLGDEITHVGEKFSRVDFEAVDVRAGYTVVSMNGPWGAFGTNVFVKAEIQFPSDYPQTSPLKVKLERTSSISDDTSKTILAELEMIAQSFVSRHKGALEAVLCYLLGERSFEDCMTWPMEDLETVSSSDDDDEELGSYAGIQSQDLELSNSGLLGPVNANAKIPRPKACGAIWADNGRLVCFFPLKEVQPKSLLGSLTFKDGDRASRNQKIFEEFGHFQTGSPGPRKKASTINTTDDTVSDGSEDSFTSSSSSSGSSDIDSPFPDGYRPSLGWRGGPLGLQRSRSTNPSQKSSAATGALKSLKLRNIVSIHNFEDLLPAKEALARGYIIFGDGPDVCAHNAKVASEHGDPDLAAVWAFVKLLLQDEVPLRIMLQPYRKEPVLVMARHALSNLKRRDSAIDLSHDDTRNQSNMTGRVRWGQHPFGRTWLVEALFNHFEQLADVQMLAMMSCIFSEMRMKDQVSRLPVLGAPAVNSLISGKTDAAGSALRSAIDLTCVPGYFPSEEVAWSLHRLSGTVQSTSRSSGTPLGTYGSADSSTCVWSSDPLSPYSTGTTPPSSHRISGTGGERSRSHTHSLSVSPEQRHTRRSNSSVTSAFAASLSRPFSLAPSAPSSPPTTFAKKGRSPAQSFVGVPPAGAVTWGVTSIFGSGIKQEPSPPVYSASESETEMDATTPSTAAVRITLKNQNLFDMEGYASIPLLNPSHEWRYRAYRDSYAQMLDIWDLPLKRCELLKFNGLASSSPPSSSSLRTTNAHTKTLISLGKKHADAPTTTDVWRGLEVQATCPTCGTPFPSSREGTSTQTRCATCATEQPRNGPPCSACGEVVRTLYAPCFGCGHIAHASCLKDWLAVLEGKGKGGWECLAGCGCWCSEFEFVAVDGGVEVPAIVGGDGRGADGEDGEDDLRQGWESLGFRPLGRGAGRVA